MGNTGRANTTGKGTLDLYKDQSRYDRYVENKKKVYAVLCFLAAIVSVVNMFVFPMFEYNVKGNSRKGIKAIKGKYTHIYIIKKYFNNELGGKSFLNTCLVILLFAMIIIMAWLVVATTINLFSKDKSSAANSKLFSYTMVEILSTVLISVLLFVMICARVDVSGGATNATGFWVDAVASIVMICTSLVLSDK